MTQEFDLIVIGAGPGGYTAAVKAARKGLNVAIIERDALGGTCLNYGCIPTKTILQSVELFWNTCHGKDMGICCDSVHLDWAKVYEHKNEVVEQLRNGIECLLEDCGTEVFFDEAVYAGTENSFQKILVDRPRHRVYLKNTKKTLIGKYILIATGSSAVLPEIPGIAGQKNQGSKTVNGKMMDTKPSNDKIVVDGKTANDKIVVDGKTANDKIVVDDKTATENMMKCRIMDSKTALQCPPRNLRQMVIIGGGVIGIELAFMYGCAGCKVVVLEARSSILEGIDKDIVQRLKALLKKRGVKVVTDAKVQEICEDCGDSVICRYDVCGKLCIENADAVIIAAGRKPETGGLFECRPGTGKSPDCKSGAEEVSINKDMSVIMDARGCIIVDDCYETSIAGIYAIGDVTCGSGFAHGASAQGLYAADVIADQCLAEHTCNVRMDDGAKNCDGDSGAAINKNCVPQKEKINTKYMPMCIYTVPEIACVGLTEDRAKAMGLQVSVRKYVMSANGKSVLAGNDRGFIKLIIDKDNHKILGAHLLCGNASDMISQFTQAMVNGLTVEDMAKVIYPHPTYAEAIGEIVR